MQLRGQGFIYVAPDAGSANRSARVRDGIWSQSGYLRSTLAHELGHVFGIPDSGFGSGLMSYDFVNNLRGVTNTTESPYVQDIPETLALTHPAPRSWGWCNAQKQPVDDWRATVLGVNNFREACGGMQFRLDKNTLSVDAADANGKFTPVTSTELKLDETAGPELINLWWPPEQTVFSWSNGNDGPVTGRPAETRLPIIRQTVRHLVGSYTSPTSGLRSLLSVDLSPNDEWMHITGVVNGVLYNDFLWALILTGEEGGVK